MKTPVNFICLRCKDPEGKRIQFSTTDYQIIENKGRFRLSGKHGCGTPCSKFIKREYAEELRRIG